MIKLLQPDRTCKYTVNIIEGNDMLQASIRDMLSQVQVDLYRKMFLKAVNRQFFLQGCIGVRVASSNEHRFQDVKS